MSEEETPEQLAWRLKVEQFEKDHPVQKFDGTMNVARLFMEGRFGGSASKAASENPPSPASQSPPPAQETAQQTTPPPAPEQDSGFAVGIDEEVAAELAAAKNTVKDLSKPQEKQCATVVDADIDRASRRRRKNRASTHMHRLRHRDDQTKATAAGGRSRWACDHTVCRELFESYALTKPSWAVVALVRLRALGKCDVCREVVVGYDQGHVIRLIPPSLGGQFSEDNAVFLCDECYKCRSRKNFFYSTNFDAHMVELKWYILRRRVRNVNNSKNLTPEGLEEFHKMRVAVMDVVDIKKDFFDSLAKKEKSVQIAKERPELGWINEA